MQAAQTGPMPTPPFSRKGTELSTVFHKITQHDTQAMEQMRAMFAGTPKLKFEPASRPIFDDIMSQTPTPGSVTFEEGEVGGVKGWWARPAKANPKSVVLYLHGGGYVIGSATAYRNFAGQIAKRAGAAAFIADYSLAPEHPFPAAHEDVQAILKALTSIGYERIALVGDSAGGGLALSVLTDPSANPAHIVGIVALSPWIDVSVTGNSAVSRAEQDIILSKEALAEASAAYVGTHSREDPRLPTLNAEFVNKISILVHVGDAEVLVDDSVRLADKAEKAGLESAVHVWEGMPHVFLSSFAMLEAGAKALDDVGTFLVKRLA